MPYLWELFGLSDTQAARVAAIITWCFNEETKEGATEETLLRRISELFDKYGISDKERLFGMYIAGKFVLAARAVCVDEKEIYRWYMEVVSARSSLDENIREYERRFERKRKGKVVCNGD